MILLGANLFANTRSSRNMYNLVVLLATWCFIRPCYAGSQSTPDLWSLDKRSSGVDCFDFNGTPFPNNTQCPDSLTCCNMASECLPNRMCIGNGVLKRPTCAVYPWNNQTCAQICHYETDTGVLPRITMCNDGSYCCDNDANCCVSKRGNFLNSSGYIIAAPSANPASTIFGAVISTATATATVTSTALGSEGMTAADKGAIGGLVAVLVLVAIGAGSVIWRKRRQVRYMKSQTLATQQAQSYDTSQYPQEPLKDGIGFGPLEIGDSSRRKLSELESEPHS